MDAKHEDLIINSRVTFNESRKIKENELLKHMKMRLLITRRYTDINKAQRNGDEKGLLIAGSRNYKLKQDNLN